MNRDEIEPEALAGMLKKAGRVVERAAKHPTLGSQRLWDISASIKHEAARILTATDHALCKDEHHRCDGGGPGEYERYVR